MCGECCGALNCESCDPITSCNKFTVLPLWFADRSYKSFEFECRLLRKAPASSHSNQAGRSA
jgi:hypothetical protein